MNGGSTIGGIDRDQWDEPDASAETPDATPQWLAEVAFEPEAERTRWGAVAAASAIAVLWVVGAGWYAFDALASAGPIVRIGFVAALCVPLSLGAVIWLLWQRNSVAEGRRYAATARAMREESHALARTAADVADHLDRTRAELAEQVASLLSLGDGAAEAMRGVGHGMAGHARMLENGRLALGDAAADAERRLSALLAGLPGAQAETEALARTLDTLGLTAAGHVAALDASVAGLAQRGREADEMASGAAQRLAAHVARMEATSEGAGARLEGVIATMAQATDAVLDRAADAIEQSRRAITAQGDATIAMLEANGAAIERASREGADTLAGRVREIDAAIATLAVALDERRRESEALVRLLGTGIASADAQLDRLHVTGTERARDVAGSIDALTQVAGAMREALDHGDATARRVIGTAEELLTALDAAAREMDETLPGALDRLDARIGDSRGQVAAAKPELLALVTAAESTHDAIEAIAGVVAMQRDTLSTVQQSLLDTLDQGRDRIAGVHAIVEETVDASLRFARDAAPQLTNAVGRLRDDARAAGEEARALLSEVVPDAARQMEEDAARALAAAVDRAVVRQVEQLSEVANRAVAAAGAATERLSREVRSVGTSASELDERLASAKAEREASDTDNLARRVSLLIEAMNSAAIDIARSFSTDVSDTAWAAYLKGDRGVFTRRAVRLVDHAQARDIAAFYDSDAPFRDQVNRYIHDFEAMLRQVLTLRDGSPLGVTLLSSDMGKLYVVLAQAIERLRG